METTSVVIEQLERKLRMMEEAPTLKKVVIGFGGNPNLANTLATFGIECICFHRAEKFENLGQIEGDLIVLTDLANLHKAESILERFLEDIIKPSGRRDFMFFFDLGDPSKKTPFELDELLDLISSFSFYGRVTLGLTSDEAIAIWSSLTGLTQKGWTEEAGRFIHYAMDIDCLLIHSSDKTIVFQRKETTEFKKCFTELQKIQSDQMDGLNAGYILGLLSGCSQLESTILGMAISVSCIQECRSATVSEIKKYLAVWKAELESGLHTASTHQAA